MTPIKILLKFHVPTAGLKNGDKFHISGRPSPCKLSFTKQCYIFFSRTFTEF